MAALLHALLSARKADAFVVPTTHVANLPLCLVRTTSPQAAEHPKSSSVVMKAGPKKVKGKQTQANAADKPKAAIEPLAIIYYGAYAYIFGTMVLAIVKRFL